MITCLVFIDEYMLTSICVAWMGERIVLDLSLFKNMKAVKEARRAKAVAEKS